MNNIHISDEAFAAYLAGFLDGEGNISVRPSECHLRVAIANTHRETIEWFRDRLGYGKVLQRKMTPRSTRPLFLFVVGNAHDCRALLTLTRPYLRVKAEQADLALEVIDRMQKRMDDLDRRNRAILEAIRSGERQKEIAARFGISQQLVSRIKSGHTWESERRRLNARQGLKKFFRPSDQVFRLHGNDLSTGRDSTS